VPFTPSSSRPYVMMRASAEGEGVPLPEGVPEEEAVTE
jgi:hypothetical protein